MSLDKMSRHTTFCQKGVGKTFCAADAGGGDGSSNEMGMAEINEIAIPGLAQNRLEMSFRNLPNRGF